MRFYLLKKETIVFAVIVYCVLFALSPGVITVLPAKCPDETELSPIKNDKNACATSFASVAAHSAIILVILLLLLRMWPNYKQKVKVPTLTRTVARPIVRQV